MWISYKERDDRYKTVINSWLTRSLQLIAVYVPCIIVAGQFIVKANFARFRIFPRRNISFCWPSGLLPNTLTDFYADLYFYRYEIKEAEFIRRFVLSVKRRNWYSTLCVLYIFPYCIAFACCCTFKFSPLNGYKFPVYLENFSTRFLLTLSNRLGLIHRVTFSLTIVCFGFTRRKICADHRLWFVSKIEIRQIDFSSHNL